MLVESFFKTMFRHKRWASAGCVDYPVDDFLDFMGGQSPDRVLGDISLDGDTVSVDRNYALSGVVAEKNVCVCESPQEAQVLYNKLLETKAIHASRRGA